ncbi:amidoligase family protein [Paenibacillus sp. MWE-103]|uniref:Amidoligase family protein n=1 Tax=Paenibacillus artemisiicola TaxID=1172618 RepID=A0ABS3WJM2_9BACL|nr:amidoligase family protein [Paenibacillus artemisiicola]MBO7748533.1 amidoligase family protein [Paenibacillus artemisiicola]
MRPKQVMWNELRFGVEIEFIGGRPAELALPPGWVMSLDELQVDGDGEDSGSELKTPPMRWADRGEIRVMLERLLAQGARANWSCGLHVHVGLEPWGEAAVPPLLDAALAGQEALRALLGTSGHRLMYCPPVTAAMRTDYARAPRPEALRRAGRPQSHRCGINAAAWYDIGTVEIRYANGSLDYGEIVRAVELCLRFVAAVGEGRALPDAPDALAEALGSPRHGYPPPAPAPRWFRERLWLEDSVAPAIGDLAERLVPGSEVLHVLPVRDGLLVGLEDPHGKLYRFVCKPPADGWQVVRALNADEPT